MPSFLRVLPLLLLPAAALGASSETVTTDGPQVVWGSLKQMWYTRYGAAVAAVDGRLYVFGGRSGKAFLGSGETYDPAKNDWRTLRAGVHPLQSIRAAVIKDRLYMVSGHPNPELLQIFEPATETMRDGPPMLRPRTGGGVAAFNGKLVVAGGTDPATHNASTAVDIFDPRKNAWTEGPLLPKAVSFPGLVSSGGRLWLIGGTRLHPWSAVLEMYSWDGVSPRWKKEAAPPFSVQEAVATPDGIVVHEGPDRGHFDTAGMALYHQGRWSILPALPTPRYAAGLAYADSRVFVLGGMGRLDSGLNTLEFLDLRTKTWYSSTPDVLKNWSRPSTPQIWAQAPPDELEKLVARGAARGDDFALVIGVENYRTVSPAAFGRGDAEMFARYATSRLGIPAENVRSLLGEKATRTDIGNQVESWLPKNLKPTSRLYVYFSGHGAPDPETGTSYLIPWDGDPEYLSTSGLPLDRFFAQLQALPAKEVVVFLDTCFSGVGGRSLIAKNLRPLVHVAEPTVSGKVTVISASAATQVAGSFEAKRHGLFTYYLLKGLGGEAEKDGHVDVSTLYGFVSSRVSEQALRDNRKQDPQLKTQTPGLRLY